MIEDEIAEIFWAKTQNHGKQFRFFTKLNYVMDNIGAQILHMIIL